MRIGHAGRRGRRRVHYRLLAIHADKRPGPEVTLVTLLGLMYLRVALSRAAPGRRRRMDDGRMHDRAGGYADALRVQIAAHCYQYLVAQIALFKQVAEAENRGLIRRGGRASIYSEEAAQHG